MSIYSNLEEDEMLNQRCQYAAHFLIDLLQTETGAAMFIIAMRDVLAYRKEGINPPNMQFESIEKIVDILQNETRC